MGPLKKSLLLLFLFTTRGIQAQTWVYHPMPASNAHWNIQETFECTPGFFIYKNYSIYITGDTIIGSDTYHKLTTPCLRQYYTPCTPFSEYFNIYRGAFREDASLKKVYFVNPGTSTENLLYDFNLVVGDTLQGMLQNTTGPGATYDTVQAIDSVIVDGTYNKRWKIGGNYLIEGMGFTFGLIQCIPDPAITYASGFSILCAFHFPNVIYPSITDCELITSIEEVHDETDLSVYPNPSDGNFNVTLPDEIEQLCVFDMKGEKVLERSLCGNVVDLGTLPSGVYLLSVLDKRGRWYYKKIVSTS